MVTENMIKDTMICFFLILVLFFVFFISTTEYLSTNFFQIISGGIKRENSVEID